MKLVLLSFLTLFIASIEGQQFEIDTVKIYSLILQEERSLILHIPKSQYPDSSYHCVFFLDGESSSSRYGILHYKNPEIPMLGIGIVNTHRNRDMLASKEARSFLEFISLELIPKIDSSFSCYRKSLYGHSFAGAFTIYAMIQKPGLFDNYIASSPTPIMKWIQPDLYKNLDNELYKEVRFVFCHASKDMKQVKKWVRRLDLNLKKTDFKNIQWTHKLIENKNHHNSAKLSVLEILH